MTISRQERGVLEIIFPSYFLRTLKRERTDTEIAKPLTRLSTSTRSIQQDLFLALIILDWKRFLIMFATSLESQYNIAQEEENSVENSWLKISIVPNYTIYLKMLREREMKIDSLKTLSQSWIIFR